MAYDTIDFLVQRLFIDSVIFSLAEIKLEVFLGRSAENKKKMLNPST